MLDAGMGDAVRRTSQRNTPRSGMGRAPSRGRPMARSTAPGSIRKSMGDVPPAAAGAGTPTKPLRTVREPKSQNSSRSPSATRITACRGEPWASSEPKLKRGRDAALAPGAAPKRRMSTLPFSCSGDRSTSGFTAGSTM